METTTLSTKGQLVIPASVRAALRLKPGNRFSVTVKDGTILLKPEASPPGWKPLNPAGASLSIEALTQPVDLGNATDRR